jgi:hypothetical protein
MGGTRPPRQIPEPEIRLGYRFWNGIAWTELTAGDSPPPGLTRPLLPSGKTTPASGAPGKTTSETVPLKPVRGPDRQPSHRARHSLRHRVVIVLMGSLVIVATVGAIDRLHDPSGVGPHSSGQRPECDPTDHHSCSHALR